MRMQADNLSIGCVDQVSEFVKLKQRYTKFGVHPGCADVLVMPSSLTGIDTNKQFSTREELGPVPERVEIVECYPHALPQSPFVFLLRCKVRRKQDSLPLAFRRGLRAHNFFGQNVERVLSTPLAETKRYAGSAIPDTASAPDISESSTREE